MAAMSRQSLLRPSARNMAILHVYAAFLRVYVATLHVYAATLHVHVAVLRVYVATLRVYVAVLHVYVAVLHVYAAVLHVYAAVLHVYAAVLHVYAAVLHVYAATLFSACRAGYKRCLGVVAMAFIRAGEWQGFSGYRPNAGSILFTLNALANSSPRVAASLGKEMRDPVNQL